MWRSKTKRKWIRKCVNAVLIVLAVMSVSEYYRVGISRPRNSDGDNSSNIQVQGSQTRNLQSDQLYSVDETNLTTVQLSSDFPRFEPGPKFILLLAYQRVGSSFIGSFFDQKSSTFYMFEPMDAVYSHLYGTAKGWAVPTDLHYFPNGSNRAIPDVELKALTDHVKTIFKCDFQHSVPEFLMHDFWQQFVQSKATIYKVCLRKQKVKFGNCQKHINGTCSQRIGQNITAERYCQSMLRQDSPTDTRIAKYKTCVDGELQKIAPNCVPQLVRGCKQSSVVMIKTVRLDMKSVIQLLDWRPNFRIIHLYRDPRSVILSRIKTTWAVHSATLNILNNSTTVSPPSSKKGLLAARRRIGRSPAKTEYLLSLKRTMELLPSMAQESRLYCDWLNRDLQITANLTRHQASKVFPLVYEDFVSNPDGVLKQLEEFLGETLGSELKEKALLAKVRGDFSKAKEIATKWMRELPIDILLEVNKQCQELFETVKSQSWKFTST